MFITMNIKSIIQLFTTPHMEYGGVGYFVFRVIFPNGYHPVVIMTASCAETMAHIAGTVVSQLHETSPSYEEWEDDYDNGAAAACQEHWEEKHSISGVQLSPSEEVIREQEMLSAAHDMDMNHIRRLRDKFPDDDDDDDSREEYLSATYDLNGNER